MITGAHNSPDAQALMTCAQGPRLSVAGAWVSSMLLTYNRQKIIIGNTVWFGKFEQRGVMNIKYCLHSLISMYVDYGKNSGRLLSLVGGIEHCAIMLSRVSRLLLTKATFLKAAVLLNF